jgi:hypothetical protein
VASAVGQPPSPGSHRMRPRAWCRLACNPLCMRDQRSDQRCGVSVVGSALWGQHCGISIVGSALWGQHCGVSIVGSALWDQRCGIMRVSSLAVGSVWVRGSRSIRSSHGGGVERANERSAL